MPHLRELVKLYEDRPFAIVGINSRDSVEKYRKGLKDHGVTWISAYQRDRGQMLNDLFKIQGFPTYYLIDADGEIVEVGHSGGALDRKIEQLVEKAEAEDE